MALLQTRQFSLEGNNCSSSSSSHSIGLVCSRAMGKNCSKNHVYIFIFFDIRWDWFAAGPWAKNAVKTNGFVWFRSFDGLGCSRAMGPNCIKTFVFYICLSFDGRSWAHNSIKTSGFNWFSSSRVMVCCKAMDPKYSKNQWMSMPKAFEQSWGEPAARECQKK